MADTKISLLTAASTVASFDQAPIVQGGVTKVATIAQTLATGAPVTASAYMLISSGIIIEATTARTLSAGDNGKVIYYTNAAGCTLTMAAGLGAAFASVGYQGAAAQVLFASGGQTMVVAGGFTKTAYIGAPFTVFAPVANTFIVSGTLA